jgi:diacylglycerol kinase family enzyme
MSKYYVLFNPLAGNGSGKAETYKLANEPSLENCDLIFTDLTTLGKYEDFFNSISAEDKIILSGGDGTINRFVNDTSGIEITNDIYYYATGTGNDFVFELGKKKGDLPFLLNPYIKDLPTVTVNGKSYKFLNGVGFGIDGYCCEEGDKLKKKSNKPVNYAGIAIKGLLFHFKPRTATITVDNKEYTYKKTWIAPTMKGKCYGGGMIMAPDQDRLSGDREVSAVAIHGSGKLKTLVVFPSIFKGEHVNHPEMVAVHKGHDITVKFNLPTALQIDGETITGVTEYTVCAGKTADKKTAASASSI